MDDIAMVAVLDLRARIVSNDAHSQSTRASMTFCRTRIVAATVCLAGAGFAGTIAGCPSQAPQPDAGVEAASVTSAPSAKYAGSSACAECHADQFEHHQSTPHGNSFARVAADGQPPEGSVLHEPSGLSYEVRRERDAWRHRELLAGDSGGGMVLADFDVSYVVGSGRNARTYLIEDDGFLAESPVTWYASRKTWDMSPGYEEYNSGFARPVYAECLFCHCGEAEFPKDSERFPGIVEEAISCERCHGPGEVHIRVQRGEPLKPGEQDTIVNPQSLAREVADSICAQCHMHSIAHVSRRGRQAADFRPGEALSDYRLDFVEGDARDSMTVVGHVEQLHLSRCYQETSSLSCIACHDPHADAEGDSDAHLMRTKCLECHQPAACTETMDRRGATAFADDCIDCHMPRTSTEVPHVAATHHRIGIHRDVPTQARTDAESVHQLLIFGEDVGPMTPAEQARALGLASLQAAQREADSQAAEAYRREAVKQLQAALGTGIDDPDVLAGLATALMVTAPNQALTHAEQALAAEHATVHDRIDALWVVSQVQMQRRRLVEAAAALEQLTQLRRQGGDWYQWAACLHALGRHDEAIRPAERAAEIRPQVPIYRELLAVIYTGLNRTEDARREQAIARELSQAMQRGE